MSKFYKWNKSGSRMILDTKLKTFNTQTNLITIGNVIADTQYSNYIRPYNEIECNKKMYNKGELRDYDLQFFTLNEKVRNYVLKHTENEDGILYQFHFYNARKEKVIIGWIFEQNKQFDLFVNCPHWYIKFEKYESAMDTCLNILKEESGVV